MSKYYCYCLNNPIDHFENVISIPDYINKSKDCGIGPSESEIINTIASYLNALSTSEDLPDCRWDGNIRGDLYCVGLPINECTGTLPIILIVKQDHAGITFIISPLELPWLLEVADKEYLKFTLRYTEEQLKEKENESLRYKELAEKWVKRVVELQELLSRKDKE